MTVALDTSVVVAFMNRRDDNHERIVAWMETIAEDLATTPLIVAEIDHLVSRGGRRRCFLRRPDRWCVSGGMVA